MPILKKVLFSGMFIFVALSAVSCAYGGAAGVGGNYVVIERNDSFLFGILRSVYVCKATPSGLTGCKSGEAP